MGAGASTPISLVTVQSATKIFVWESLANKSIQQITFCTASGQTSGCGSIQSSTNRDLKVFTMTKSNERIVRVQFQQSLKLGLLNIQFTTSTGQMSSRFGAKRIDADYLSYVFAAPSHSGGIKSIIVLSGAMIIAGFELMDSSIFGIAVKSAPNGEFQPKKNNNKNRRKSVDTIDPKDLEDFVEDLTEVLEMLEAGQDDEGRHIDDVVDENGENIGCDGFNVDDEERFDGEHSGLSEDGDCAVACGNEFDESYGYNGGEFNDEGEHFGGGYDGAGFGAGGLDGEDYDAGVFDVGGYDNTGVFDDGGCDLNGYDSGGFDGGGYTGGFDAGADGFGGGYEVGGFCGGGYDAAWGSC